jgi:hypothetical protein
VFRKDTDGPAARPETPLAVENSVGEPAAVWRQNGDDGNDHEQFDQRECA